ncbi:MAG: class I SAM-dependent methyltransferase [Anaerolineae bacterium]|nr:class I SAM-dependent methyltransferase [Anaerolineae bacterium]
MRGSTINSNAFDAFAADYDHDFTHSTLGQLLRPRVWAKLAEHFNPGDHVLELACGTGEDAVWLAKHGVHVTATDGSAAMVGQAKAKAETEGVGDKVAAVQVSLQEIISGQRSAVSGQQIADSSQRSAVSSQRSAVSSQQLATSGQPIKDKDTNKQPPISSLQSPVSHSSFSILNSQFSGVFSNFGGLNTINQWRDLAQSLAKLIKPGGKAVLVPMGRICPWEMGWYLLHGQPRNAFRRFGVASAKIGEATIPIWYPSAKQLRAAFEPWFEHVETESLGLLLPPSYIDHFVERRPALFAKLNKLETMISHLARDWGDHYIITFERK